MAGFHDGKGSGKTSGFLWFGSGEGVGRLRGAEDDGVVVVALGGGNNKGAGRGRGDGEVERLIGVDLVAHP